MSALRQDKAATQTVQRKVKSHIARGPQDLPALSKADQALARTLTKRMLYQRRYRYTGPHVITWLRNQGDTCIS